VSLKPCLVFLVALHAPPARPFETRWTAGLQVQCEEVSGRTSVGGMSFVIQRASGRDVPLLAQRILDDWRRESGVERVRVLKHGDWSVGTRIHDGRSQVTQWRISGDTPELLWSEAELYRQPLAPKQPRYLTPLCSWVAPVRGTVAGNIYSQSTGRCAEHPSAVLAAMQAALVRAGWEVRTGSSGLNAHLEGRQVQVVVTQPDRGTGGRSAEGWTDAVVLEVRPAGRPGP